MRKTVAIASLAFGLSLAGVPAVAGSGGHISAWYQTACTDMQEEFDAEAASRKDNAHYNEAVVLRNQGTAECAYGDTDTGSEKLRFALQAIGLYPNY